MIKIMFKLTIAILAIYLLPAQTAVIRTSDELETTTATSVDLTTTMLPEFTTTEYEDLTTTTTERFGALSRDEEATILVVDQTLLDPAPAELKTEPRPAQVEKSGKLLLLSTPKIAEKPKQPEENLEDSEEVESETVAIETTTTLEELGLETTTAINMYDEHVQTDVKNKIKYEDIATTEISMTGISSSSEKVTKLYPINDTLYAQSSNNNNNNSNKINESSPLIISDQPKEMLNSNLGSIVLEESEAEYVLVDSELLEGSYTDIDSELHLQPIVQSVEIVPSSLDNTLLSNYVQSW